MTLDVENSTVEGTNTGKQHTKLMAQAHAVAAADDEAMFSRTTASYVNEDARFRIPKRAFERQYAQLYFARLQLMAAPLKAAAAEKWPHLPMVKILDVGSREEGQPCCVLGTLYKDMKLKPSILDEYTKDRGVKAALNSTTFCSDDDGLALEDEGGRMQLRGEPHVLPVQQLATGVVVVVRGENKPGGDFEVHEVLYADMAPQPPVPDIKEDKYCAFISGLRLSNNQADMLQLSLALDMLTGHAGGAEEQQLASQVVRLVVAGGCIGSLDSLANANAPPAATTYGKQPVLGLQPVRDLDMLLSEVSAALPVDVMPGAEDPANVALPQQPLHRCLLPGSSRGSGLERATNPHHFSLDGLHFLGSSGQPLEDLTKYSSHADRLDALEACVHWRHLAPTAPDTLAAYPYFDDDPFIISTTPHIMFAANQPSFDTRLVQGKQGSVRLVLIPDFSKTGCVVLVNLRTREASTISFKA